ncbi:hypothetical protein Tco_1048059 [Tanacetum coccineum]
MVIIWSGYFGWIATLIPFFTTGKSEVCLAVGSVTILYYTGVILLLCKGDGELTIMKFIQALVECSLSPSDTSSDIYPNGQEISLLDPRSRVVAGIV